MAVAFGPVARLIEGGRVVTPTMVQHLMLEIYGIELDQDEAARMLITVKTRKETDHGPRA